MINLKKSIGKFDIHKFELARVFQSAYFEDILILKFTIDNVIIAPIKKNI